MFVLKFVSALVLLNYCLSADFDCEPCQCTTKECFLLEADCSYKSIETELDQIPGNFSKRIDEMNLSEQPLKILEEYVFKNANLSELQVLTIINSQISDVHKNAFDNMTKLTHLYLSDNNISYIHNETMYWLRSLETLDLSQNNLNTVPDVQNFARLKELSLSDNKICYINEQFLENTTAVESLHLSHNKIETIANKTFGRLTNLRHLYLSNNSLTRLPVYIFQNNTKLRILTLENNTLVSLSDNLLQNLTDLTILELNNNKLRKISDNLCNNKTRLIKIDLSHNDIEELSEYMFNNLPLLHILKLSYNNIKLLRSNLLANENCRFRAFFTQVYLDHNYINEVPSRFFGKTCSNIFADLSYNNISKIDPNALLDAKISRLDLSHNELTILSKDTFKTDLSFIDLSYNKLTVLPDNIFNSYHMSILNLNNNNLKTISSKWFGTNLVMVMHLEAANNNITSFEINSKQILSVDLLNNKLNCDCNMQPQFQEYNILSASIECYSPIHLRGKNWNELHLDQFACSPKILDNITEISSDGATKLIGCKVYGAPPPKIRWIKNNITLPDNAINILKSTPTEAKDVYWYNLTFSNNTTDKFAGQYFCELSNEAGLAKMNFTVVEPHARIIHVGTALWITAIVLILVGIHVVLVMFYLKRLRRNTTTTSTSSDVPYENVEADETQAMF